MKLEPLKIYAHIEKIEDSGHWFGFLPDFPAVVSQAKSVEELLCKLKKGFVKLATIQAEMAEITIK